jgi:hypothetical protein
MVTNSVKCSICEGTAEIKLHVDIHNRQKQPLFQCLSCSFRFFHKPDWLPHSFSSELNQLDLGSVSRCLFVADFVTAVFSSDCETTRVLDWGGGDGLLTRLLRERGIDCVWHDPFVQPRFVGDAIYRDNCQIDVAVASEVFLHMVDPLQALRSLLAISNIVVLTAVVPPKQIEPDWWYLMPETGQHVSFYPFSTLRELAHQTDTYFTSDHRFFHVFSRQTLSIRKRLLIRVRSLAFGLAFVQHAKRLVQTAFGNSDSLTASDQARLIEHRRRC